MSDAERWLSVGSCCHAAGGWRLPQLIPAPVPVLDTALVPSGPGRARLEPSQLAGHQAVGEEAGLCPWGWNPQGGRSWVGSPGTLCCCFVFGASSLDLWFAWRGGRYETKQGMCTVFVIGVSSASLFC